MCCIQIGGPGFPWGDLFMLYSSLRQTRPSCSWVLIPVRGVSHLLASITCYQSFASLQANLFSSPMAMRQCQIRGERKRQCPVKAGAWFTLSFKQCRHFFTKGRKDFSIDGVRPSICCSLLNERRWLKPGGSWLCLESFLAMIGPGSEAQHSTVFVLTSVLYLQVWTSCSSRVIHIIIQYAYQFLYTHIYIYIPTYM